MPTRATQDQGEAVDADTATPFIWTEAHVQITDSDLSPGSTDMDSAPERRV
jgi:hypothetical protein